MLAILRAPAPLEGSLRADYDPIARGCADHEGAGQRRICQPQKDHGIDLTGRVRGAMIYLSQSPTHQRD